MTIFISGGCKSGKSSYAERIAVTLAKQAKPLYYIATMLPADSEDKERIARHRQSRAGLGFETVEITRDISKLSQICDISGTFLLDSVTALLANEMFRGGEVFLNAGGKIAHELTGILSIIRNMVIVSDYIYSDAFLYDEYTEAYRQSLARIDGECAGICEVVLEVCCGQIIAHKGANIFGGLDCYETLA